MHSGCTFRRTRVGMAAVAWQPTRCIIRKMVEITARVEALEMETLTRAPIGRRAWRALWSFHPESRGIRKSRPHRGWTRKAWSEAQTLAHEMIASPAALERERNGRAGVNASPSWLLRPIARRLVFRRGAIASLPAWACEDLAGAGAFRGGNRGTRGVFQRISLHPPVPAGDGGNAGQVRPAAWRYAVVYKSAIAPCAIRSTLTRQMTAGTI